MNDDLIDQIYEAALFPDLWTGVLEAIESRTGSAASSLIVFSRHAPPRFKTTQVTQESLTAFVESGAWKYNPRQDVAARKVWTGFDYDVDVLPPEVYAEDPVRLALEALGLAWQAATIVPLPSARNATFTFERWQRDGRHEPEAIEMLNGLRPHLARAALIASRLGLERARAAVATLEALGLPAAVLSGSGHVLAVNDLFEAAPDLLPGAHGRLVLREPTADQLLREVIAARPDQVAGCSLPIAGSPDHPAAVLHVLPLRGNANDLMGGSTLVVLVSLGMDRNVPDPGLLHGLFDLTPSEGRLAASLAAGRSLKEAAEDSQVRVSTARSYLEGILRKTGTKQQSQLVALLKGTTTSIVS